MAGANGLTVGPWTSGAAQSRATVGRPTGPDRPQHRGRRLRASTLLAMAPSPIRSTATTAPTASATQGGHDPPRPPGVVVTGMTTAKHWRATTRQQPEQ